ncbi:hypothetical protein [Reichenbachiella versicolor]|uniref:hypothetical protein n=1 Tax=Reichenbachiella versicolor TaxID=1821036 RepID=UPI000D6E2242|nr:hypothetical protein [Reichenbachiella versicolor]
MIRNAFKILLVVLLFSSSWVYLVSLGDKDIRQGDALIVSQKSEEITLNWENAIDDTTDSFVLFRYDESNEADILKQIESGHQSMFNFTDHPAVAGIYRYEVMKVNIDGVYESFGEATVEYSL